ncbi:hypothetical protein V8J36_05230 [Frigidibacter sp. MR17.14]|uniref:hypothetical protein n=1 Tax=Frigidibacter sp. MR17.14 TaxID=3126509 RepID=UPI003012C499
MRGWLAAGALAVLIAATGSAYLAGRSHGATAEAARQLADRQRVERRLQDSADEIARRAVEAERLRRERDQLAREIENEAFADPASARAGVDAAGVQRLERRWGSP